MSAKSTAVAHDPLQQAHALIAAAADEPPRLAELARRVGLSASHLQRAFRKRYGLSPAEYAQSLRLQRLKSALRDTPRVTDAIYDAGYGSGSRVYEKTGQLLGMTPATYRRGGTGVAIKYTTLQIDGSLAASGEHAGHGVPKGEKRSSPLWSLGIPSEKKLAPLGYLLVAASERGICTVTLGDDEATLTAGLRAEFPDAAIERVDAGRDDWLAAMIANVAADLGFGKATTRSAPPLDIRATAFQWRVWQALQRIPRGQTRSYSQIAAQIGTPRSVRAVANACARNHLAIVVPCHRVIREDGSLGGYRWGIERKRALLAREAHAVPPAA
jgi:AraC family transcriptional regulator of adaptative response/methylated-DNA-[protein]-cysteine methyltransferase